MSAGHIRARGPGAWELKYDLGRDPITGKRQVRYKTVRGTKRDAQRELRELLGAVDKGRHVDPGKLTVGAWLGQWLEEARHNVSPKTHERYAEIVHKHLVPALGAIPLAKLAPVHIRATTRRARQRPPRRQGRAVAADGGALRPRARPRAEAGPAAAPDRDQPGRGRGAPAGRAAGDADARSPRGRPAARRRVDHPALRADRPRARHRPPARRAVGAALAGRRPDDGIIAASCARSSRPTRGCASRRQRRSAAGGPIVLPASVVEVLREHGQAARGAAAARARQEDAN